MAELTQEQQIAKDYLACTYCVDLINAGKPEFMNDEQWADALSRNKRHLQIMLAKDIFAGFDIAPLQVASAE